MFLIPLKAKMLFESFQIIPENMIRFYTNFMQIECYCHYSNGTYWNLPTLCYYVLLK